jgi:general secretion pathway protein G
MIERKRSCKKMKSGFTMLEVMAVLVILGLLATVVVKNVAGRIDKARVTTSKANIKALHDAVNQFKMDTGQYPSEDTGLEDLVVMPGDVTGWDPAGYLETTTIPTDAWGGEFVYERYPESGKPFVIISFGADKEPGGEDLDADLLSTDAN